MPGNDQTPDGIDWSLTTWEGSRREQLRRWAALPLERIILAIEEMEELADRFGRKPEAGTSGTAAPGQPATPADDG